MHKRPKSKQKPPEPQDQREFLEVSSEYVVNLVKVLDHHEAELLVYLFAVIPTEFMNKKLIAKLNRAVLRKKFDEIRQLLEWYVDKVELNQSRTAAGEKPISFDEEDPKMHPRFSRYLDLLRSH